MFKMAPVFNTDDDYHQHHILCGKNFERIVEKAQNYVTIMLICHTPILSNVYK